ncbi:protein phosphatase 2C domain-containing protein [Paenibacillus sp. 19GGS1-52]|uniref:protein phosphatase 2C domain-containing protein n=1 Tax=Paenibacillus sp. 19GGS1-52 TaxID=2758563 RepID=UPI001EFB1C00|nr:protein phosphatase 2C domain-containing protein [Paenibacillus sp. 19GGS1-52]ULO05588.1 protein phosphatase 2C domain-containing protein [Paenibacillus sp. 19GGS1-52]
MGADIDWISVQGTGEWNEDAVILNHDLKIYGVVDGATSLVPYRGTSKETGGRLASQLIKQYAEQLTSTEFNGLDTLLKEANSRLGQEMERCGINLHSKDELWTAGAALIRITDTYIEFIQVGDCMIYAMYEDGSIRSLTRDHVAAIDLQSKRIWEEGIATGVLTKELLWEMVKPVIAANKQKMNTPEGYSIINGMAEAEPFFEYGRINLIKLHSLLLVTDGLFYPGEVGNTEEDLVNSLVRYVTEKSLEQYAEWLLQLERADTECIQYPRFKISDDKTGIYIRLT